MQNANLNVKIIPTCKIWACTLLPLSNTKCGFIFSVCETLNKEAKYLLANCVAVVRSENLS